MSEIGYMTPGELRQGVGELRDAWNQLRNQIEGRGAQPRTDLDLAAVATIAREYAEFRAWYNRISASFARDMFGMYQGQFQQELKRYQNARSLAVRALGRQPSKEPVTAPPLGEWKDAPFFPTWAPWAVVGIFVAWLLWSNRSRGRAYHEPA